MSNSFAYLNGQLATNLSKVTNDLSDIESGGKWLIVGFFEGLVLGFKFEDWQQSKPPTGKWSGSGKWESNLTEEQYADLVSASQQRIAIGDFYQVNVCQQFFANWNSENEISGLFNLLQTKYPSQYASLVNIDSKELHRFGLEDIQIASASPELFLKVDAGSISSSPIKGTVESGQEFLEKDISENVMIVDLVRNDLSRICKTASVQVPQLLARMELPNLDHLVSTVNGQLQSGTNWNAIIAATFPPGSVTGAPKISALEFITENEPHREIYCGTIGWIDNESNTAELSVAIRTFWKSGSYLRFGAGAGITWASDPKLEWQETQLKAQRLIDIASEKLEEKL
jgi:para-aminobenzoate synthetase component 1